MATEPPSIEAQLMQWRQAGAAHRDPLRFGRIVALAARVPHHHGAARQALQARLQGLLQDFAAAQPQPDAEPPAAPVSPARRQLQDLLAELRRDEGAAEASGEAASASVAIPRPVLPALAEARATWDGLRADQQLRQAQLPAPADAGPLNSSVLVHRALSHMREVAPGYLRHFLAYVDALAWLQQMQAGGVLATPEPARPAVAKKATRARSRRRSE